MREQKGKFVSTGLLGIAYLETRRYVSKTI